MLDDDGPIAPVFRWTRQILKEAQHDLFGHRKLEHKAGYLS